MSPPVFSGGKLSFKGDKKSKKKLKKSKHKKEKHHKEKEYEGERIENNSGEENDNALDNMTEAERKNLRFKTEREEIELKELAVKSHRERVEMFNDKLSKLTEHNDIPRVSFFYYKFIVLKDFINCVMQSSLSFSPFC